MPQKKSPLQAGFFLANQSAYMLGLLTAGLLARLLWRFVSLYSVLPTERTIRSVVLRSRRVPTRVCFSPLAAAAWGWPAAAAWGSVVAQPDKPIAATAAKLARY